MGPGFSLKLNKLPIHGTLSRRASKFNRWIDDPETKDTRSIKFVIDPLFPFFTNISPREQFNARFFPGFRGPNQKQLANQPSLNGATAPAATTSNFSPAHPRRAYYA